MCIAHTPQNASGVKIYKEVDVSTLFKIFNMWKKNFNISLNFKPALTNEEFTSSHIGNCFEQRIKKNNKYIYVSIMNTKSKFI